MSIIILALILTLWGKARVHETGVFLSLGILHSREEKVNPKLTAYQVELAQVEAEIEKLLDERTRSNPNKEKGQKGSSKERLVMIL